MRLKWVLLLTLLVFVGVALLTPTSALAAGPVIVLDPGHSGTSLTTIDPQTQIQDEEYCNTPEITDVFDVALDLKGMLEKAGYTVLLTKQNAMDTVTKRERADIANNAHAALAVSIHTSGHSFGTYGQIYVQTLTSYRENIYGQSIYFTDPAVAALSAQYGQIFLAERRKIEGSSVVVTVNSSFGDRDLAPGNIPLVQLFSEVPWIYCEAGVPANDYQRHLYAESLFNSIVKCVPINAAPPTPIIPATRFEQTDDRIVETGTWYTFAKTYASGGSYGRSCSSNASATINFIGTRLDLIAMEGTTTGIVDIYVDGKLKTTINLASAVATYQVKLWSTGELADGFHTVELVRDPESPSGKYITLDAVDVVGTLTSAPPTITSLAPSGGGTGGGNSVLIAGTGFTGVTHVTFGDVPATITSVNSATRQITALAPAQPEGTVHVHVTAAGGITAETSADDYTYAPVPVPTVTALGPASGPTSGSTGVIITGTNLGGATSVTFGGVAALRYAVNSGTQIMAIAPAHAGGAVDVRVSTAGGTSALVSADHFTYVSAPLATRQEQTASSVVWTGTWTLGSSTAYSGGSLRFVNTAGASVTIPFTGTYLAWIAKTSPAYGLGKVTVDGVRTYTVNLYSASTFYRKMVWNTGILPAGPHWVRIEWTGVKGASTGGTYVNLDAVDVAGSLMSSTRFEQTDTRLVWLPSASTWTTATSSYYSGGSLKYLNKAGSVTVNFTGLRLALIAKKSPSYGYAKLTLDGSAIYLVNLYSASTLYRRVVWSSPFLRPGTHTFTLTWTGTKGASTGGTYVNLDAVTVWGGLR